MELPIKKPDAPFVMVPTEPTPEMLDAYDQTRLATTIKGTGWPATKDGPELPETYNPHQSYWALLNAAPPNAEYKRLRAIEEAAMALSTAMVESEATGADYDLVDDEWIRLTEALQPPSD